MSASSTSRSSTALPASDLRLSVTLRLLRFMFRKPRLSSPFILKPMEPRVWSPPLGGSILITSAPRSASSMQA
jgi:hypothetical protein